jgi:hypothetical protein
MGSFSYQPAFQIGRDTRTTLVSKGRKKAEGDVETAGLTKSKKRPATFIDSTEEKQPLTFRASSDAGVFSSWGAT